MLQAFAGGRGKPKTKPKSKRTFQDPLPRVPIVASPEPTGTSAADSVRAPKRSKVAVTGGNTSETFKGLVEQARSHVFEHWEKPHRDFFEDNVRTALKTRSEKTLASLCETYLLWDAMYSARSAALLANPGVPPPSSGCKKCRDAVKASNPEKKKGCTVCGMYGVQMYIESKNARRSATMVEIPTDGIVSENHRPWNYRENAHILVKAAFDKMVRDDPLVDKKEALCKSVSAVRQCRFICQCKQWDCICIGNVVREVIDSDYETDPESDEVAADMLRDVRAKPARLAKLHRAVLKRGVKSKFARAVIQLAEGTPDAEGLHDSPREPGAVDAVAEDLQLPSGSEELSRLFDAPVDPVRIHHGLEEIARIFDDGEDLSHVLAISNQVLQDILDADDQECFAVPDAEQPPAVEREQVTATFTAEDVEALCEDIPFFQMLNSD
jgi:hypothetical protein